MGAGRFEGDARWQGHHVPLLLLGAVALGCVTFVAFRRGTRAAWAGDPQGRAVLGMLLAILLVGVVNLTLIQDWVRCEVWICLGLACGLRMAPAPGDLSC